MLDGGTLVSNLPAPVSTRTFILNSSCLFSYQSTDLSSTKEKQMLSFKKNLFVLFNLFLAVLGLCCCMWAFTSCGEQGLLFVAVRGLLTAVVSLVVEHGL